MIKIKKYFLLSILLLFASLNFNLILKPLKLVTGGTQGLAIILNNILTIKPFIIILTINITTLILSHFLLSKENTYSALASTFIYPLFIKITSYIPNIPLNNKYLLIYAIIAGIICGLTGGYIYKLNFSSGGITIINLLIYKYFHIKIYISNFIINSIIIILGCFNFGIKKTIYSIIVIAIGSLIINKILKQNKQKSP